ncbi:MAG TPA: enoyl-CoA hydratase-related protein [Terriglobales bacterium]|jgi:cyclohexa-1,5-dienecarbonyl-CoA hydratase|nr:enoyl-CoA hydratase-related protein [Terriglobales bacterium]
MGTATITKSRIEMELQPPVARLRLQNHPLNVIDILMMEELAAALAEIEANPAIVSIVVSGSQKAFSVGVDVAAHTPDKVEQMLAKFHSVIRALVASKKVTIATVHGHCLGGGAELAMVCDLVYTSELATWGFPEIKLGCYPPVAVTALAALVGQKQAADLVLTGRSITGREAAEIGLANWAAPDVEVDAVAQESVERLKQLSPAALAVTKKAIYAWDSIHFDKGLARAEKIYFEELMRTCDAQEGINAFLEKRQPKWTGK